MTSRAACEALGPAEEVQTLSGSGTIGTHEAALLEHEVFEIPLPGRGICIVKLLKERTVVLGSALARVDRHEQLTTQSDEHVTARIDVAF